MILFRPQNHPKNDPRALPEPLWSLKWPCDPPWGLPGRLFGSQSRRKSTPKAPQRQPKTHQRGLMAPRWSPPVTILPPKAAPRCPKRPPRHPKARINCPPQSSIFSQNPNFSFKITAFQYIHKYPYEGPLALPRPFFPLACASALKSSKR